MYYVNAFQKFIGCKPPRKVIYLQGDCVFFIEDILRNITFEKIYAEPDEKDIIEKLNHTHFLTDTFCVVVRNIDKLSSYLSLMEHLKTKNTDNYLVCISEKPIEAVAESIRYQFFKYLKQRAFYVDCKNISLYSEERLKALVKALFERCKVHIDANAQYMFIKYCDMGNLDAVYTEVQKIAVMYKNQVITPDLLKPVLNITAQHRIYVLQKYIGLRDLKRSLAVLNNIDCSTAFLCSSLYLYFKNIMRLKDLMRVNRFVSEQEISNTLHLPEKVIGYYIVALKNFNNRRLVRCMQCIRRTYVRRGDTDFSKVELISEICI